ncbi:DNA mismatch repair protein MutL [Trametopsis cervina]|nr:DNA mismatch repair protein MutL [Trametopsis cervina]
MVKKSDESVGSIKAIDALSVHRITSGQVVIDLQTAIKELVENSLDAGATNIEVRFKDYGIDSIEVVDNGAGIAPEDYDAVGLKHHTSKLQSYEDLESVSTFGFRGEALSSLCALCSSVTITTATEQDAPMGTILKLDSLGRITSRSGKAARQRGTTVAISDLFKPLPVRRKEFERNAKREYGKALNLLNAYALLPCTRENGGVRLVCTNQTKGGKKAVQLRTDGSSSIRASVSSLWGSKTSENLVDLDISFDVETERSVLRRQGLLPSDARSNRISVRGLISKFALNCGRSGSDRQFFYINGRPCNPSKAQKAFNEVYKTFNATQSPMIIADFILPKDSIDLNVSPDKRTIFIHSEDNLVQALKAALEERFAPERSTYTVAAIHSQLPEPIHSKAEGSIAASSQVVTPLFDPDSSQDEEDVPIREQANTEESTFGAPTLLLSHEESNTEESSNNAMVENMLVDDADPAAQTPATDTRGGTSISTAEKEHAVAPLSRRPPSPIAMRHPSSPPGRLSTVRSEDTRANLQSTASLQSGRKQSLPSIRQIPAPRASSSRVGVPSDGQLTLSTTGASWNLRPAGPSSRSTADDERPHKRQRVGSNSDTEAEPVQPRIEKRSSRKALQSKLTEYALPGSQVARQVNNDMEDETSGDEDSTETALEDRSPSTVEASGSSLARVAPQPVLPESGPLASRPESASISVMDVDVEITRDAMTEAQVDEDSSPKETEQSTYGSFTNAPGLDYAATQEYVRTSRLETSTMRCDEVALLHRWSQGHIPMYTSENPSPLADNICKPQNVSDDTAAAEVLSRVISKSDFADMDVIGQFNLGFIIARLRRADHLPTAGESDSQAGVDQPSCDDLFIVDQHAADEKYNFEQLQETTKIDSQALFRPRVLELTAADQLLAIDNVEILRRNGFEIDIDNSLAAGEHRLRLLAQPVSKATVFDISDLEELLQLLRDSPRGQVVRCSKARSMFAMRACRKSIMVGMPLQSKQMTSVIRHMGTMEQPWNCPHGRPTMRHLADIARAGRQHTAEKVIEWDKFY